MKIKKFRIKPRLATVGRILKGLLGVRQLPPDLETALPETCEKFLPLLTPAAFYQTWSRDQVPSALHEIWSRPELTRAIAFTVSAATIGVAPDEYLSRALMNGETQMAQVITALCEESADVAFQFMERLLRDNAERDDCETTMPIFVTEGPLLAECLQLLGVEGGGIQIDTTGHLSPRFTRFAVIGWLPLHKKKKTLALPKKTVA